MYKSVLSTAIFLFSLAAYAAETPAAAQAAPVKKAKAAKKHAKKQAQTSSAPAATVRAEAAPANLYRETLAPSTVGQSRTEATTILPRSADYVQYSGSAELTFGSISNQAVGGTSTRFTTMRPQINALFKNDFGAYAWLPVTWGFVDSFPFRYIGRPELGGYKTVKNTLNTNVGVAVSMKPGLADSSVGDADTVRSWQAATAATVDQRLGRSRNHVIGVAQLAYDFPTNYKDPAGVNNTVEHALAVRTTVGISRETPTGSVGLAIHGINGLGSSVRKDASTGAVLEEKHLSLSSGELFGTYQLAEGTRLNASVAKGFNTDTDGMMIWDNPRDVADTSLSLGVTQTF